LVCHPLARFAVLLGFAHFCVIRFTPPLLLILFFERPVVRARVCVSAKEPARFFEEERVDIRRRKTALKLFRVLVQKAQNPKLWGKCFPLSQ